jgi:protein ImuB
LRIADWKNDSSHSQREPLRPFVQPGDRRDRANRAVSCDLDRPKLNRIATPPAARVTRSPNPKSAIRNPQSSPPPFALVRTAANRQTVVAVCEAASARGIRPGLTLAEAKALCPGLEHAEHDVRRDALGLRALGRWMMRFTPVVAVMNGPDDPLAMPNALLLDVTGCERVFRGLDRLVAQVVASLDRFEVRACIALGPKPAAAWARTYSLSPVLRGEGVRQPCDDAFNVVAWRRSSPSSRPSPRDTGEREEDLPCESLRLDDDTVAKLYHLGIHTIGQLMAVPRDQLPARFGPLLALRLDQLAGVAPEPLVPMQLPVVIKARMDFDGVVTAPEALWAVFRELLGRVITQLERHGRGVRELDVTFVRAYATPVLKTIRLSRPSRDPVNLFNLFRCATEQLIDDDTTDEFLGMRLLVRVHEPLPDEQIGLLEGENYAGERELDRLVERLCARMGEGSVTQVRAVESHVPERAFRHELARQAECDAGLRRAQSSRETPVLRNFNPSYDDPREHHPPAAVRPLRLLRRPVEVPVTVNPFNDRFGQPMQFVRNNRVHRLAHVVGPERIGGQWWDGHDKTRDYFDVEDDAGERFWIFRVNETRRWFLHGQYT